MKSKSQVTMLFGFSTTKLILYFKYQLVEMVTDVVTANKKFNHVATIRIILSTE